MINPICCRNLMRKHSREGYWYCGKCGARLWKDFWGIEYTYPSGTGGVFIGPGGGSGCSYPYPEGYSVRTVVVGSGKLVKDKPLDITSLKVGNLVRNRETKKTYMVTETGLHGERAIMVTQNLVIPDWHIDEWELVS